MKVVEKRKLGWGTKLGLYAIMVLVFPLASCSTDGLHSNTKEITGLVFLKEDNPTLDTDIVVDIGEADEIIKTSKNFGADLGFLVPDIKVSEGASYELIGPDGQTYRPNVPVDLNSPIHIQVTAQDGTSHGYTLVMEFIAETDREALIAIQQANPSSELDWPLVHMDIDTWEGVTAIGERVVELSFFNKEFGPPGKSLANIPKEIGKLTELTSLELGFNGISRIPPEIGNLTKLTFLNLQDNYYTTVPSELGKLKNLIILDLSHGQLESIPAQIGDLSNLTHLKLHHNQLTSIPQKICALGNAIRAKGGTYNVDDDVECVQGGGD